MQIPILNKKFGQAQREGLFINGPTLLEAMLQENSMLTWVMEENPLWSVRKREREKKLNSLCSMLRELLFFLPKKKIWFSLPDENVFGCAQNMK